MAYQGAKTTVPSRWQRQEVYWCVTSFISHLSSVQCKVTCIDRLPRESLPRRRPGSARLLYHVPSDHPMGQSEPLMGRFANPSNQTILGLRGWARAGVEVKLFKAGLRCVRTEAGCLEAALEERGGPCSATLVACCCYSSMQIDIQVWNICGGRG